MEGTFNSWYHNQKLIQIYFSKKFSIHNSTVTWNTIRKINKIFRDIHTKGSSNCLLADKTRKFVRWFIFSQVHAPRAQYFMSICSLLANHWVMSFEWRPLHVSCYNNFHDLQRKNLEDMVRMWGLKLLYR